jgi:hypothetical protein
MVRNKNVIRGQFLLGLYIWKKKIVMKKFDELFLALKREFEILSID